MNRLEKINDRLKERLAETTEFSTQIIYPSFDDLDMIDFENDVIIKKDQRKISFQKDLSQDNRKQSTQSTTINQQLKISQDDCLMKFFQFTGFDIKKIKKLIPDGWHKSKDKNFKNVIIEIDRKNDLLYTLFYLKPKQSIFYPKHENESERYYMILNGTCCIQTGDLLSKNCQGDFMFIPSNIIHSITTQKKEQVVIGCIQKIKKSADYKSCKDLKYSKPKREGVDVSAISKCRSIIKNKSPLPERKDIGINDLDSLQLGIPTNVQTGGLCTSNKVNEMHPQQNKDHKMHMTNARSTSKSSKSPPKLTVDGHNVNESIKDNLIRRGSNSLQKAKDRMSHSNLQKFNVDDCLDFEAAQGMNWGNESPDNGDSMPMFQ